MKQLATENETVEEAPRSPRVVYVRPPVELGRLIERTPKGWRVRVGGDERVLAIDPSVQERLLENAFARHARVLVEHTPDGSSVVGVVMTALPASIDDDGQLHVEAEQVILEGRKSVTVTSGGGMVHVAKGNIELYGREVLTRAREVAKVLARMISLN